MFKFINIKFYDFFVGGDGSTTPFDKKKLSLPTSVITFILPPHAKNTQKVLTSPE